MSIRSVLFAPDDKSEAEPDSGSGSDSDGSSPPPPPPPPSSRIIFLQNHSSPSSLPLALHLLDSATVEDLSNFLSSNSLAPEQPSGLFSSEGALLSPAAAITTLPPLSTYAQLSQLSSPSPFPPFLPNSSPVPIQTHYSRGTVYDETGAPPSLVISSLAALQTFRTSVRSSRPKFVPGVMKIAGSAPTNDPLLEDSVVRDWESTSLLVVRGQKVIEAVHLTSRNGSPLAVVLWRHCWSRLTDNCYHACAIPSLPPSCPTVFVRCYTSSPAGRRDGLSPRAHARPVARGRTGPPRRPGGLSAPGRPVGGGGGRQKAARGGREVAMGSGGRRSAPGTEKKQQGAGRKESYGDGTERRAPKRKAAERNKYATGNSNEK